MGVVQGYCSYNAELGNVDRIFLAHKELVRVEALWANIEKEWFHLVSTLLHLPHYTTIADWSVWWDF